MENCTYIIYLHLYGKRCQLIVLAKRSPIMSKSFWCALVKRLKRVTNIWLQKNFPLQEFIFQSRKLMTFTSLKVEPLHYTEKSFVSTSVNVNNVSTDLRSLRDYCPPHTSELTLKTDLRPSFSFAAQLKWQSSRLWDWKQIHIWA